MRHYGFGRCSMMGRRRSELGRFRRKWIFSLAVFGDGGLEPVTDIFNVSIFKWNCGGFGADVGSRGVGDIFMVAVIRSTLTIIIFGISLAET
jgi:hypothetical protein